jgi:hypothetical protein
MKCPVCGAETGCVYAPDIDLIAYEDILGCDDCLPEDQDIKELVPLYEDRFEDEDDVDEDGYTQSYWDWYDMKETEAVEAHYGVR